MILEVVDIESLTIKMTTKKMEKKVQQVSNIFNMKIAHVITDTIITTTNIIHIHDIKNALTKGI